MKLILSSFGAEFSPTSFRAKRLKYNDIDEFKTLRERVKGSWFLYRRTSECIAHEVIGIPLDGHEALDGEDIELLTNDNLTVLSALLKERLPQVLPDSGMQYTREGLLIIDRTRDLVSYAFKHIHFPVPTQLVGFHKYKKSELDTRVIAVRPGSARVVVSVNFGKYHEIDRTLLEVVEQGIDVRGLCAIDRVKEPGPRFIGEIVAVEGEKAIFEVGSKYQSIPASECLLEPSLDTFTAIFSKILGDKKKAYDQAEWNGQATVVAAPSYLEELKDLKGQMLGSELKISRDITVRFSELVQMENRLGHESVINFGPIQFCFDSDRSRKHRFPSAGLEENGPFDQESFDKKTPRILVVGPADVQGKVEAFVKEFKEGLGPQGQKRYSGGFGRLYRLVNPVFSVISANLAGANATAVGGRYRAAIESHLSQFSHTYDAAIVVLKDEHAFTEPQNPYLISKAYLLGQGIPVQEVRLSKIGRSKYDLQYIYEDISVALYSKLGGTPWTVMPAQTVAHEIIFGMGTAEIGGRTEARRRYVGITTVFKSDGNYLLSASTRQCRFEEYPEALKSVVEEILDALKQEHSWRTGETVRLVFHSYKPLRNTDIATITKSALDRMGTDILFEYAFLDIKEDHPFLLMDLDQNGRESWAEEFSGNKSKGVIGQHVPPRGLSVELSRYRRLLCVNGPELVRRHKEPLPKPLLIEMHRKSTFTDMTALTRQVFYFTGLSWRSMRPSREPATILYSALIARLMSKLGTVPNWSPDLLNTKLRRSRWFL
ncbi:MAG: hypothetical protein A4E19_18650 [Nitrospira sp. SG-bin1]|nr:hypothetical protein [Nitrospira sp.]OQW34099.1 MAG: hypothetical protein A4E19_18650 [Nitrospira sp. SG-bin1]